MEKIDEFKINMRVKATSPLLISPFVGEVVGKNVHTCIVKVIKCHEDDEKVVNDLHGLLVCKNDTIEESV